MIVLSSLFLATLGGIHMALPPADTIFVMDATIADPVECQCQRNIFIHMANYTYKQKSGNYNRFGLIAYADTTVLLYRLLWPLDLKRWNQVVNGMKCTGGTARLDLVYMLAKNMYTKGGRPNSAKMLGMAVSVLPTVPYKTPLNSLFALGVDTYTGLRLSSTVNAQTLVGLSPHSPYVSSSYCAFLALLPTIFPL